MNFIGQIWSCALYAYKDNELDLDSIDVEKDNDFCRIHEKPDTLIIAFRGSNDNEDWANNFKCRDKLAHKGFRESFRKFIPVIEAHVKRCSDKKIYITGHSRGAALATLCSEFIASKLGIPVTCIAFASPKIYSAEVRNDYNLLPIHHVVVRNGWDIVTFITSRNYKHVGKLICLKKPWYHRLMYFRIKDHTKDAYSVSVNNYGEHKSK